jgi:hypothetical protein
MTPNNSLITLIQDKLICLNLGPFGRFNWQQNFNTFSFAVLFDLGGDLDDSVGHVKACPDGQVSTLSHFKFVTDSEAYLV